MFDSIPLAPPDPILGLAETFAKDPRPDKINLTIGVFQDELGRTPVLQCVKKAEQVLLQTEQTKSYLSIDGLASFRHHAFELALGGLAIEENTAVVQTPGGTGALKVVADLLRRNMGPIRVWVSLPTWPNHNSLFQSAGLEVKTYPYLSADKKSLDFEAMIETLRTQSKPGDVLCLHGCCHNPSGIDPTIDQWNEIARLISEYGLLPLVDFAYQGFGDGLEEDRVGLRIVAEHNPELICCTSFSKNFGLYSERVGALMCLCVTPDDAIRVSSSAKQVVRTNYSNPPRHGGALIATVLGDPELRDLWSRELAAMRSRIHAVRKQFVEGLKAAGCTIDFSFLLAQRGMFSFSGLTPLQVDWLRNERAIYLVGNGRMNVAGITPTNQQALVKAIMDCLESVGS